MQNAKASTFVEVGTYSGAELTFKVTRPQVKVGSSVVNFAKASIALRTPHEVIPCESSCAIGTVMESAEINFNVVSEASLDVLKAEVDRVFLQVKTALAHGVLPAPLSTFSDE